MFWPYRRAPGPPQGESLLINSDSPQAAGLVHCYAPLASGGAVRDLRLGADAVLQSTTTLASDPVFGLGVNAVAGGQYALATPPNTWSSTGNWWISAWVRMTGSIGASSAWTLASAGSSGDTAGYLSVDTWSGNQFIFVTRDSGFGFVSAGAAATVSAGTVVHLVGVHDPAGARLYINGLLAATSAAYTPLSMLTERIGIGASPAGGANATAVIGDVRVGAGPSPSALAWQLYDPATRWELYAPPRRFWLVVASGATTTPLSLSGTQAQAGSLSRNVRHLLSGTQGQSGTLVRTITHPRSGTQAQSGSLVRTVTHLLAGTQAQSGSISKTQTTARALSGTQGQSGSLTRQVSHPLSGTQAQAGAIARSVTHRLSGTQGQSASAVRTVTHVLGGTQAQAGTTVSGRAFLKTLSGTQGQSGGLTRTITHVLGATQPQAGTLARPVTHALSTTQSQSAGLARTITHPLATTQAQAGTVVPGRAFLKTLSGSQTQAGTLSSTVIPIVIPVAGYTLSGTQAQSGSVAIARTVVPHPGTLVVVDNPVGALVIVADTVGQLVVVDDPHGPLVIVEG